MHDILNIGLVSRREIPTVALSVETTPENAAIVHFCVRVVCVHHAELRNFQQPVLCWSASSTRTQAVVGYSSDTLSGVDRPDEALYSWASNRARAVRWFNLDLQLCPSC